MLLASPRHTAIDLQAWDRVVETARVHARLRSFVRQVTRSQDALLSFTGSRSCYAGVSWGKDSVVLAHLVATLCPRVPLVWVRVEPIANPDCVLVRDAFLRLHHDVCYDEIVVRCQHDSDGWHAGGTLEHGFAEAAKRYSADYLSGIRAEESGIRKLRVTKHGLVSRNTCAPIGWWSAWDIWAYLVTRGLPIHPAYACSLDGALDHGRIRVASLGGKRGDGMGRAQWEWAYYRQEMIALGAPRP